MADQYTEVTRQSFFSNVMSSFVAALIGVVLFFASFFVLWINEGTVNLASVARKSTSVAAAAVDPAVEGKLVAATGTLATTETLGDSGYLQAGSYLALERNAEMFAWVEHTSSKTTKNVGGSSTTETTYTYEREWTSDPEESSSFRHSAGHDNPAMALDSQTWTVNQATLGAYTVDPQKLTLPDATPLKLNEEMIEADNGWQLKGEYLVNSPNALQQPQIGDVRVQYAAVPGTVDVTLFGKASGNEIVPFETKDARLYRAFTENREQAIETLNTEYTIWLWVMRLVGFLMMWIGMSLCFSPINAVLNILPFLGNMSSFLIGAVMFGVALLLSMITIIASIIAHNIFLLIGLLLLIMAAVILWSRMRRPSMAVAST